MSENNQNTKGISFTGLLTIALIVLKLTDTIDWSWWWVLSPITIPAVVLLLLLGIIFTISKIWKI